MQDAVSPPLLRLGPPPPYYRHYCTLSHSDSRDFTSSIALALLRRQSTFSCAQRWSAVRLDLPPFCVYVCTPVRRHGSYWPVSWMLTDARLHSG